jgi:hypothetical protein
MTFADAQHVVAVGQESESMMIGRFELDASKVGAGNSDHVAPASLVTRTPLATGSPWASLRISTATQSLSLEQDIKLPKEDSEGVTPVDHVSPELTE